MLMKPAIIALAVLGTATIATAALAAKQSSLGAEPPVGTGLPRGQCIRSHEIRNHTIADDHTMLIDVNGQATYRITVGGACMGGAVTSDPIITREPPGSHVICKPIDMDLSISKSGFESRCIVQSIVKLSPQEVAALPKKLKP
jgi:hypothetical protein